MNNDQIHTLVKFNKDAIDAIYRGVKEVTEATATTLGPLGRNVLIDKGYQTVIVHDGVTVANSILPKGEFEKNGAKVIQEAAKKQRDMVGDGTTAVMILAQAILDETLKATASGINPMTLRHGLESGAKKITAKLKDLAIPVKTLQEKIQVATISAEDKELGKLVAETIHKIGNEGILTVEESKASETYMEHQEGMQIDKPYVHYFMITDSDRQVCILEDAYVLVTDIPLNELATTSKFLEQQIFPNTRKVLFISPDISGDFLMALIGAKMQGKFLGLGVRAPGIGMMQTEMLQDICALTGATFISKEAGHKFDDFDFKALGHINRVVSSKWSTLIQGGSGHKEDVLGRVQVIKKQLEDETISEYDKEQLKGRLGKLTSGIAVIKVGGLTEVEMKERKERCLDAVASTQSAVKHGMLPGGEVSYLNCLDVLDERILGEKILKEAIKKPFKRLVENAGYDSGEKYNELFRKPILPDKGAYIDHHQNEGFDVTDGQFKDMIKSGIVDSAMIPVVAIETAVSVAVQLSSLGAAVVLSNEESDLMELINRKYKK